MTLAVFVKNAAGPNFAYEVGDIVDFSAQSITNLGDAVVLDTKPGDTPTKASATI